MQSFRLIILIAAAAAGAQALAKPANSNSQGVSHLQQALASVAVAANPQGPKPPEHFSPKVDNDQGDDHANPGAILKVCSKDTPAAHRSAICPTSVSPD